MSNLTAIVFFLFLLPCFVLIPHTVVAFVIYKLTGIYRVVGFKRIIIVIFGWWYIQSVIHSLFGRTNEFLQLPVSFIDHNSTPSWTIQPVLLHAALRFGNTGYEISIPNHLLIFNIVANGVTILYFFLISRYFLKLSGRPLYIFWVIMCFISLSVTFIQNG